MKKATRLLRAAIRIVGALFILPLLLVLSPLAIPFWWLFVYITNARGVHGVRKSKGALETRIDLYEDLFTGRKVVLIGTMHFADPSYWQALKGKISTFGFQVLYEGVEGASPVEERKKMTQQELGYLEQLVVDHKKISGILKSLGLQYQPEGFGKNEGWINMDVTVSELMNLLSKAGAVKEKPSTGNGTEGGRDEKLKSELARNLTEWKINMFLCYFPQLLFFLSYAADSKGLEQETNVVIVHRDSKFFEKIEELLSKGSVTAILGPGHLVGVGNLLKKAGYQVTHQEWVTAIKLRRRSMVRGIKELLDLQERKEAQNEKDSVDKLGHQ